MLDRADTCETAKEPMKLWHSYSVELLTWVRGGHLGFGVATFLEARLSAQCAAWGGGVVVQAEAGT